MNIVEAVDKMVSKMTNIDELNTLINNPEFVKDFREQDGKTKNEIECILWRKRYDILGLAPF